MFKNLKQAIDEYINSGGESLLEINNNKNHCILYYEKFYNNFDEIFVKLEIFFNEKYSSELKDKIKKGYRFKI